MVLLHFFSYLKPFRLRLAIAIACMVVVSAFGAFNIMMLVPFLNVLLNRGAPERVETAGERGSDAAPDGAVASPAGAVTEVAGGLVARPLAAFRETTDAAKSWYAERAAEEPMTVLVVLCGALLLMTGVKCAAEYASNYQLAYTFYLVNVRMRSDIYRNILRQDYLFFTRHAPGYLLSRVNSDIRAIQDIVDKLVSNGVQQPLTLVAMSGVLLWISPRLTLIVVVLLPVAGGFLYRFSRQLRKNTKKEKKKADELSGTIAESLFNIRLVKSSGSEEVEMEKFARRNMQLFRYVMNRRVAKFASSPIMEFVGTVAASGVLLVGGYVVVGGGAKWVGALTPAEFLTYLLTLSRFYRPMRGLSQTALQYQIGKISAERIQEMLRLAPTIADRPDARPFEGLREGIEFRDVGMTFGEERVLHGANVSVPRGKTVALVGRSGSGKTTLANFLPRLYDPTEGAVLIDGLDARAYRLADLHRRMGVVTQQTNLFDDTVANNIAYGLREISGDDDPEMGRIVEAARAADADDFIRKLDGGAGYGTKLGAAGTKISGGQAQRIAIARAIYRDPDILILDEATSALDSHAQRQVQEAVRRLLKGRTALVIAHRLSTVRDADRIYVLDAGRVVEEGTHDELMALRGHYHALYRDEESGEGAKSAPPPPDAV